MVPSSPLLPKLSTDDQPASMQSKDLVDRVLWPALRGEVGRLPQTYTLGWAYLVSYVSTFPILLFGMDAPHGRFAGKSVLNVNGNIGWLLMELVSPVTFWLSLTAARPFSTLTLPTRILALAFLTHYTNRAVISVIRQKGKRSPMHIVVPLFAATFNLANGHTVGTWLSGATSSASRSGAVPETALYTPAFVGGVALWVAGFVGNLVHDEILRRLRGPGKPAYSIPHGLLYDWPFGGISFPNYLCEWAEWAGFAIAATHARCPPPLFGMGVVATTLTEKLISPPWLFVGLEIVTMLPRALSGHRWYKQKFGEKLPRGRKAVTPGVL